MTKEEIFEMSLEDLEERAAAIAKESADADAETLAAFNAELDSIEERRAAILADIEQRKKAVANVVGGAGKPIAKGEQEERTNKTMEEIRNSKEYIDAYAKYIKTGKADECRALLTENVTTGTVPVPDFVENRVRTAWERDEVWRRIRKTYVRGNLKVGFEGSATEAAVHTEGDMTGPAEEQLVLGTVTMVPETIKKWITFSTEVMALAAEDFLMYIYDELTYKIIRYAATLALIAVASSPQTSSATAVGVPKISGAVTPQNILAAIATLGDSAIDRVIVADGATIAAVRSAALSANYAYDPFFGLTVIQHDGMDGAAIVGDLSGVQANMPEGDNVRFVFDEFSLAEHDMIKLVGRLYAAIAVVDPGKLAIISGEQGD